MVTIHKKFYTVTIDLVIPSHIALVSGDSGTGKTFLFNNLKNGDTDIPIYKMFSDNPIDTYKPLLERKEQALVLIDRADIFLTDEFRGLIVNDPCKTYLIFGRNPNGLRLKDSDIYKLKFANGTLSLVNMFQ